MWPIPFAQMAIVKLSTFFPESSEKRDYGASEFLV